MRSRFNFPFPDRYYLLYTQGADEANTLLTFKLAYKKPYYSLYTYPKHELLTSFSSLTTWQDILNGIDIITHKGAFDTADLNAYIEKFYFKSKEKLLQRLLCAP